jgi:hypothetical protein
MRFGVELRASPPKHSKEVILRPGVLVVARDLNFSGDQKIRVVERSKSVCVWGGGGDPGSLKSGKRVMRKFRRQHKQC